MKTELRKAPSLIENAWYFRNALVRANYNNLKLGIHATQKYLDRFFANLLLDEKNELKNRDLLVTGTTNAPIIDPINVPIKISVNGQKVLMVLKESPHITVLKIAEQIRVSDKTVKRALRELKDAGLIERIGSNKTGHWIVKAV